MNARLLALISRRPHLHAQHLRGSLRAIRPASPLIDLLSAVSPRDHTAIKGLKVGPDLGYLGARSSTPQNRRFAGLSLTMKCLTMKLRQLRVGAISVCLEN